MTQLEDTYPLAPIQRGMLFHHLVAPRSGVDIVQLVCVFSEPIDEAAFENAWQRIVQRHPVLRTGFRWQGLDDPVQEVHHRVELTVEPHDLRDLSEERRQDRLESFLRDNRQRGFDLTRPPLMRLALIRTTETKRHFVWTFHHILLDGRSIPVVFREFSTYYDSFRTGNDPQLPLPLAYRDYVDWVARRENTGDDDYWRRALAGFSGATTPCVDRVSQDSLDKATDHAQRSLELSGEIASNLRALAQEHGFATSTLVHGAWALLLSRYSGEADVVFGTPKTLRGTTLAGAESMVGLLLNTVPLRVNVDPAQSLVPWLRAMHESQWHEMRNGRWNTPLVDIERCSKLPRGRPLFESLVVFENYRIDETLRRQGDLWSNADFRFLVQTNYPLTLCAYLGSDLLLEITFDRSRFEPTTIETMLRHLRTLLAGMTSNPGSRLADIPLMTEPERHQVLSVWNQTQADYPKDACLHELFEEQVERNAQAVALRMRDVALTFDELNRRANQLAHYLQRQSLRPQQPVGILMDRSLELFVGLLGILKSGGAYVPLDASYPERRLAFMVKDSGAAFVVTRESMAVRWLDASVPVIDLDRDAESISREPDGNPTSSATADSALYVMYTSGSTGKPKGVVGLHRGAVNRMQWMWKAYPFREGETCCARTAVGFVDSVWEIFGPLCHGVPTVIIPDDIAKDPRRLIDTLADGQITRLGLVPSLLRELLNVGENLQRRLSKLETCIVSGEVLPAELAERFRHDLPRCRLLNLYGSTEVAADVTFYDVTTNQPGATTVPIGRPISNTQIYLLDASMQPVPVGMPGELHVGGACLARGYHNRSDLTRERFVEDPFSERPGARLFKTGDVARYRPDGNLEFLARRDHQVKIRGCRVELGEVESVLREHPCVRDAVVIAQENAPNEIRLVAYLVRESVAPALPDRHAAAVDCESDDAKLKADLRGFLKRRIPAYSLPSALIVLDVLPLTAGGKVDRLALPPIEETRRPSEASPASPRDAVERRLVEIWQRILRVTPVGVRDDFFDLGGDSLMAVRLFVEIERAFHKDLPLSVLFEAPTVEGLAEALREPTRTPVWTSLVPIKPGGSRPPFFCVHGGRGHVFTFRLLAGYLGADQPFYGVQPLGLSPNRQPHVRVEDMATHYLQEIRSLQPKGPYYLGGWCFSGMVVFEMAQQLLAAGEQLAILAIFDGWAPGYPRLANGALGTPDQAYRFGRRIGRGFDEFSRADPKEKIPFLLRITARASKVAWRRVRERAALSSTMLATQRANKVAMQSYKPATYPGRVTLFRASERRGDYCSEPTLGWEGLAGGGVEVHEIPGHHLEMYEDPHVRDLAKELSACLEKARNTATAL